jgi:hypothetical protein
MNPLINLKRTAPVAFDQCIICQDLKRDELFDATLQGLASVREATSARNKLRDVNYKETIERLVSVLFTDPTPSLVWHKSCYAAYTHKEKIERLQRRLESTTSSVPISDIPLATSG